MNRLILWLRLRAKETHLDGIEKWAELTGEPGLKNRYVDKRMQLEREAFRAGAAYKESIRFSTPWGTAK